jgi:hypothetical protein
MSLSEAFKTMVLPNDLDIFALPSKPGKRAILESNALHSGKSLDQFDGLHDVRFHWFVQSLEFDLHLLVQQLL